MDWIGPVLAAAGPVAVAILGAAVRLAAELGRLRGSVDRLGDRVAWTNRQLIAMGILPRPRPRKRPGAGQQP